MTTTDREKGRKDLELVTPEDVERIERDFTAGEPGPGFGFVEPPPPYHPGPRRKLPAWAKHLRSLRHLGLVE